MKIIQKLRISLAVFVMAGAMSACTPRSSEKPVITVSIQPQKYLLEQIVGDKIDVRCLLANGGNPESYEPSLTHLMNLERSEAYFRIGNVGFESAIIDRIRANNPHLKIYNTSDSVTLIIGTHGGHDHEVDPHTWSSVRNGKIIASNMYKALVSMEPENEKYYTRNYCNLMHRLDSIDGVISHMLEPKSGAAFLVWHPSLSYFARDYGLRQLSVGSEGKEVSVQQLRELVDDAKAGEAMVFFTQKDFDSRQASIVAAETGAEIIPINLLDYDWENGLLSVAAAIASK